MNYYLLVTILTFNLIKSQGNVTTTQQPLQITSIDDFIPVINEKLSSNDENITTFTNGEQAYMHSTRKKIPVKELRNKVLRMVVPAIEPPYVNYVNFSDEAEKDRGYGPGIVIEILKEIGKSLNLTYEIVQPVDNSWGTYVNGTWTGAFGMLYRKEIDILAGAAIMQYERSLITDLTYPFQYELTGMLIRSPEKYRDDTMLIVTEPFRWQVWAIVAVSIAVSSLVLLFLTYFIRQVYDELQYSPFESLWVFFSIFVQQGLKDQPKSWSCRVLIALWWCASITLMATFTGSLVALFAVDKMALPFQNLEGLVKATKQGKYSIIMNSNSLSRTEMIARSPSPLFRDLWHEMTVNHRSVYINGMENSIRYLIANPGYVLLGPWETLTYRTIMDCRLYLLSEGILPVYLSIPLAKDSPYSNYFSSRIREMVERGFTEKWNNDYRYYIASQKNNRCNATTVTSHSNLNLRRAQGAFWILLGGLGLSIVLLLVEFVANLVGRKFHVPFLWKKQATVDLPDSPGLSAQSTPTLSANQIGCSNWTIIVAVVSVENSGSNLYTNLQSFVEQTLSTCETSPYSTLQEFLPQYSSRSEEVSVSTVHDLTSHINSENAYIGKTEMSAKFSKFLKTIVAETKPPREGNEGVLYLYTDLSCATFCSIYTNVYMFINQMYAKNYSIEVLTLQDKRDQTQANDTCKLLLNNLSVDLTYGILPADGKNHEICWSSETINSTTFATDSITSTIVPSTNNSSSLLTATVKTTSSTWKEDEHGIIKTELALLISIPILLSMLIIACGIHLFIKYKSRKNQRSQALASLVTSNIYPSLRHSMNTLIYPSCQEFLGHVPVVRAQGGFGVISNVLTSHSKEGQFEVAIKRLPSHADSQNLLDFFHEISFMKRLGYHVHVIGMLGCVSDPLSPSIAIEYCDHGDLLNYLRKNRRTQKVEDSPSSPSAIALSIKSLVSISWQISDGISYLHAKKFVHRDIAARNILLSKNMVAKVSDFGLCRYTDSALYTSKGGKLPIKWMALESLKFYEFSDKSDVWSFGVCLWEIFSHGNGPFPGLQPLDMLGHLEKGNRLLQSVKCPNEIYSLMQCCWKEDVEDRFTIDEMRARLMTMLDINDHSYGYLSITQ